MAFDVWLLEDAGIQLIDGDRGKNYPGQSDFSDNGYCLFLSAKNVTTNGFNFSEQIFISSEKDDFLRAGKLCRGDIVVTTRGTIGNIAFFDETVPFENVRINSGMMIFRADEKLWNRRLLYFLLTSDFLKQQIISLTSGSAVPQLPARDLKKFKLPKIPLAIQDQIADVIGSVSDKIELNRQINQTLEQIAQTIFKSWFVDFEPVKAKIEAKAAGRDPERAAMCAISGKLEPELDQLPPEHYQQLAATAALFPDELVESELGLIPVGWEVKPFGELLEFSIGGDWGQEVPDEQHTEKVNILRGTDLPRVYGGDDSSVPTRYVESKKLEKRLIIDGDIVIEVSGGSKGQPTGRSLYLTNGLMGRLGGRLEPASFCRLFRPINSEVGLLLAVHLAKIYEDGKTWLYQNQSTGISNFQTTVFLEKELIFVPCNRLLNFFYVNVRPLFDQIYSGESQSLRELRDVFLPKLLSGDIKVEAVRGAK